MRVSAKGNPQSALNKGEFIATGLMLVISYFLIQFLLPETWNFYGVGGYFKEMSSLGVFFGLPLSV